MPSQNPVPPRPRKLGSSFAVGGDVSPEQRAQNLADQAVELLDALKEAGSAEAVKNAKALQFVFYGKGGVVVSRAKGSGFSLLRTERGWSAPLFLELDTWALGFTLGFKAAAHVVLAYSDDASKLLAQQGVLHGKGAGAKLTVGSLQTGTDDSTHDVTSLGTDAGLLLDVSVPVPLLAGDLRVATITNQEIYGEGGHYSADKVDWPARVLRGEGGPALDPPVQFSALYSRLAELGK